MPNSGEISWNGDPRSEAKKGRLEYLNLKPQLEQPVQIQTSQGPYTLEPELAGSIPRRVRWRGGWLNPIWRARLLVFPTLICLYLLISPTPYFFLASAPKTAFDKVPARAVEFPRETSVKGYVRVVLDYSYKNVQYREGIFAHPDALQYLNKEIEIEVHPLFPSFPLAEKLGQEVPFGIGVTACWLPGIFFTVLGAFWSAGVLAPLRRRKLVKRGLPYCATVTSKTEVPGFSPRYELELCYQVSPEGQNYKFHQALPQSRWKALQIGDRLTVLHDLAKPKEVAVYSLCEWKAT